MQIGIGILKRLLFCSIFAIVFSGSGTAAAQPNQMLFTQSEVIGNGGFLYPYGNGDLNRAFVHPADVVLGVHFPSLQSTTRAAFLSISGFLFPLTPFIGPASTHSAVWSVGSLGDIAIAKWNGSSGPIQTLIWNPISSQLRTVTNTPASCGPSCAIQVSKIGSDGLFFGSAVSNPQIFQGDLGFTASSGVVGVPQANGEYLVIELDPLLHSPAVLSNPLPVNERVIEVSSANDNRQALIITSAVVQGARKAYLLDWNSGFSMTEASIPGFSAVDIADNGTVLLSPNSNGTGQVRLINGSLITLPLPALSSLSPGFPALASSCAAPNTSCAFVKSWPSRMSSSGRYVIGSLSLSIQTTTTAGPVTTFGVVPGVWQIQYTPAVSVTAFQPITQFAFTFQGGACNWSAGLDIEEVANGPRMLVRTVCPGLGPIPSPGAFALFKLRP